MIVRKIDLLDGRNFEVVVRDEIDYERLRKFCVEAGDAFNDRDRWAKVRKLMTHERSGPNHGWTLSMVLPGDDPDQAIDNVLNKEEA